VSGELKRSFAPVVDAETQVLILGSLPGEASLKAGQYYGHPRNQFWRLIEAVTGAALPAGYPQRLEALRARRIGVWDVVKQAIRPGSLDAAIRDHAPNALAELAAELPRLGAIGFNGAAAAAIGTAALSGRTGAALIPLPSSSPAYTLPFEAKAAAWARLAAYLA
jgi:hypoxanthine-DNA glycosylase